MVHVSLHAELHFCYAAAVTELPIAGPQWIWGKDVLAL